MRPAVWLLISLIFTIAVSLIFVQYISALRQKEPENREGFFNFLVMGILAGIDRGMNDSCRNKTNDKANRYAGRNAYSGERDACNGKMFQHYPPSDETVKRWDDSKRHAINRALNSAGVNFVSNGEDIEFLLTYFREKYNFDILTYPYDGNMNPFYELIANMKRANAKSFKDYLELNNQVKEGYSGNMNNIGCYNDNPNRAITHYVGQVNKDNNGSAESKCADKAVSGNSRVFGLQWRTGDSLQCFVGDGKPNEVEKAMSRGATKADCTQQTIPWQNNVFVLPPKPQAFTKQQTFDLYAANPEVQRKIGVDATNYTEIIKRKNDIDKALQPVTEGLDVLGADGKYVGMKDRERGGATTWNTFNVSDQTTGKEAVEGCKKICDRNASCGAVVVQKRAGPWDCWTVPNSNLNGGNAKKTNPAQATYYKSNVTCAKDATCNFMEPFTSLNYNPVMSNKDFPGFDFIGSKRVNNANECKMHCNNNDNKCKGFVLDRRITPNNCWLKSTIPQGSNIKDIKNIDTYSISVPEIASTTSGKLPISTKNVSEITSQTAAAVPTPKTNILKPMDFNRDVSAINRHIRIRTSIPNILNSLQADGISLKQGFATIEGVENQVKTVSDYAVRMGVNTDIELIDLTKQIKNKYGFLLNAMSALESLGVKYSSISASFVILDTFGMMAYDSLMKYNSSATNGTLRQIGIRPSVTIIDIMNKCKLNYAEVMNSSFVPKMKGFGFNANSNFAGILNGMLDFGIDFTNFDQFRSLTGMKNINELPEYIAAMKAFGIFKYDADHEDIVKLAVREFSSVFPGAPSLSHTRKVLRLLTDSEIPNINIYRQFRAYMSNKFNNYDNAAFRESLIQFGTFKNRGSDNGGRFRKSEIEHVVNTLSGCGYFNNSNKVTFKQVIDSLTSQSMRLYVAGDQTDKFMDFGKDACSFMRSFNGNQSNFGPDKQGFTTQTESFTNAYSIARNFGISNPVQAVLSADSSNFLSEPDFYTKINSFGIDSVSKYDNLVKVFNAFGSNNSTFCKVTEKLKVFGVPSKEYVSFVQALTTINVTYPYFDNFIDTIMDFGVVYQANLEPSQNLYYRFLTAVYAFGVTFTTPDSAGNNTFYTFLSLMKSMGLAVGYPNSPYPCNGLPQPPDAFFNAIKTFIVLGYTVNTFLPSQTTSGSSILMFIRQFDCQLLDFTTPDLFNMLRTTPTVIKLAKNMNVKDSDKYLKYYSEIFVQRVDNKVSIVPNVVFSFMQDENYSRKTELTAIYYRNSSAKMETYINHAFMNGDNVRADSKNEYEMYNLNMNTLRLFPNYSAAFIKDVVTNPDNPYNATFNSPAQEINPNKQRGCDRFMKISLNNKQRKQCPK